MTTLPNTPEMAVAIRGSSHGDWDKSAEFMSEVKGMMKMTPNWSDMPARQREALEMVVHKVSRILHGDYNDPEHWVDAGGYLKLGTPGNKKPRATQAMSPRTFGWLALKREKGRAAEAVKDTTPPLPDADDDDYSS